MGDLVFLFPEDLYKASLVEVNEIHFTQREIDVVACLISARRTSAIASLLSISPSTVTTHLRNIMLKVDCNTQDGVINFFERSSKLHLLRHYYEKLVTQAIFDKTLKTIGNHLREEVSGNYAIISESEDLKETLLSHLTKDLQKVGLGAHLSERSSEEKSDHQEGLNFFLCSKDKLTPEISCQALNLGKLDNYYLIVFRILNMLFPTLKIEGFQKSFEEQLNNPQNFAHEDLTPSHQRQQNKIQVDLSLLRKIVRKRGWIGSIASMLLIFSGSFIVSSLTYPVKPKTVVRSDLSLPHESILLERPALLKEIDENLKKQEGIRVAVVTGIGGAGKTTLAHHYSVTQSSPIVWLINAETKSNVVNSFETLACSLAELSGEQEVLATIAIKDNILREKQIFSFVKRHLKSCDDWLLIYDNVNNFSEIRNFFSDNPQVWGNGRVILTTVNENITKNRELFNSRTVKVPELSESDEIKLYSKIMRIKETSLTDKEKRGIQEFLRKIPSYPLDISLAAHYLREGNISFEQYLQFAHEKIEEFSKNQIESKRYLGGYSKTRQSIILLPLQTLIKKQPHYERLLLFTMLVNPQKIPKKLLYYLNNEEPIDSFINDLKKYSFIANECQSDAKNQIASTFSLHSCIKEMGVAYFSNKIELNNAEYRFTPIIIEFNKFFFERVVKNYRLQDLYLLKRHCKAILDTGLLLPDNVKAVVLGWLGVIHKCLGNFEKAQEVLNQALICSQSDASVEGRKTTAWILVHLGTSYRKLTKYEKAKVTLQQAVDLHTKHYGRRHPETAWAMMKLGTVHRNLGQYSQARKLLEEAYQIFKTRNDTRSSWAAVHLGNVYRRLGKYQQARELLEGALPFHEEHYGKRHLETGWVMVKLGNIYGNLGQYSRALEYLERGLLAYKHAFGPEHTRTAQIYGYIGRNL